VVNADAGSRVLSRDEALGLGARRRQPVQPASQWRFCCPSPTSRVTPPVGTGPADGCAPRSRAVVSCHPLAFVDVPRNLPSSSADVGGGVPAVSSHPRRSALPARHPIDPAPHDLPGDLCVHPCQDDHLLWVPRAVGPPPRVRLDVHPSAFCLNDRRQTPARSAFSVCSLLCSYSFRITQAQGVTGGASDEAEEVDRRGAGPRDHGRRGAAYIVSLPTLVRSRIPGLRPRRADRRGEARAPGPSADARDHRSAGCEVRPRRRGGGTRRRPSSEARSRRRDPC
jgi:hypothetical protein